MPTATLPAGNEAQAVQLARKLVLMARAQDEALRREAPEQFDWLVLRRQAVVDRINALLAAGLALNPEQVRVVERAKQALAQVDAGMQQLVRDRLEASRTAKKTFERGRRAMAPYLMANWRTPAFVDRNL